MATYIFDIGGVIVHPDCQYMSSSFSKADIELTEQQCQQIFPYLDFWSWKLQKPSSDKEVIDKVAADIKCEPQVMQPAFEQIPNLGNDLWTIIDENAIQIFERLQNTGASLVALSNSTGNTRQRLEEKQLAKYFNIILDSAIIGLNKPDLRIFELAARLANEDTKNCIYIGDSIAEVQSAQTSGYSESIFYDYHNLFIDEPLEDINIITSLNEIN